MKTAIVNTFDARGGAAIATYRIHKALRKNGVDSHMFVAQKDSGDPTVIGRDTWRGDGLTKLRTYLDNFPLRLYKKKTGIFSTAWVPDRLTATVRHFEPDVIHLFWVTGGLIRIESLRHFDRPIVWTLHDMWPFTGGCHYDNECGKYAKDCGECPGLGSTKERDLSRYVWKRKAAAWKGLPITLVATSKWLIECAKSSSLFRNSRIELIPNCLDMGRYKPTDKHAARDLFGLSQGKTIVLFSGADAHTDKRKGLHHLFEALGRIAAKRRSEAIEVVLLGIRDDVALPILPFTVHCIPVLKDEVSQVALYSAANVLVAPSLQENLSNAVVEALACGIPVVAFEIGGMPDLISHRRTGYLARPFDTADLAAGIEFVLDAGERRQVISDHCRDAALQYYSEATVAHQYEKLYVDLVANHAK